MSELKFIETTDETIYTDIPSQLRRRRAQRQGYQVSGRRGPHPRRVHGSRR